VQKHFFFIQKYLIIGLKSINPNQQGLYNVYNVILLTIYVHSESYICPAI